MTALYLTKLREIAEAATPDDWERVVPFEGMAISNPNHMADADHIATFDPPTVLALIDEVERLRRWKREAKQVLKGLGNLAKVADAPLGHPIIESAIDCILELRKKADNLQPAKGEA